MGINYRETTLPPLTAKIRRDDDFLATTRKTTLTIKVDGTQKSFAFPFDYLQKTFVKARVDAIEKNYGIDYTVTNKQIDFMTPPSKDSILVIYRDTTTDRLVSWEDASILRASDMTLFEVQLLHIAEETSDAVQDSGLAIDTTDNKWDARLMPIKNVTDPVENMDVINKRYFESFKGTVTDAQAAQIAAASSATNAHTSEVNAKVSEQNAKTSEVNAKASETNVIDIQNTIQPLVVTATTASVNATNSANSAAQAAQDAATSLAGVKGLGAIPVGMIIPFLTANVPPGYLLLSGPNRVPSFDTNSYPDLFSVLGTNILPDFTNRFPQGAGDKINGSTFKAWRLPAFGTNTTGDHAHSFNAPPRYFDEITSANEIVAERTTSTNVKTYTTATTGAHSHTLSVPAGNTDTYLAPDAIGVYWAIKAVGLAMDEGSQTLNKAITDVAALRNRTANVKDFGAVGDGVTDDTSAINAAINSISYNSPTATLQQINDINKKLGGAVYFPKGVYKYTSTLFIPSHVTLKGEGRGYFNGDLTAETGLSVLHYTPLDTNTAAMAGLVYKNNSGTYNRYTDFANPFTGTDLDTGTFVSCAGNVVIENISISTTAGVKYGLVWCGCAGGHTSNFCIGNNDLALAVSVGMVSFGSWGSQHYNAMILAKDQGVVCLNANGGMTFYSLYCDRPGVTSNETATQTYSVNVAGSTGLVVKNSDVTFYNPIVEHWYLPCSVYNGTANIYTAHFEGQSAKAKYNFNVYGSSVLMVHNTKDVYHDYTDATTALFYLDSTTTSTRVRISGLNPTVGQKLLIRNSSFTVLEIEGNLYNHFLYGTLPAGNEPYINITGGSIATTVYMNQATGDDTYWGTVSSRPVKTLARAIAIARALKIRTINVQTADDILVPSAITLNAGEDITITGMTATTLIDFQTTGYFSLPDGYSARLYLYNIGFKNTNAGKPFQVGAGSNLSLTFSGTASLASTNVIISFVSTGFATLAINPGVTTTGVGRYAAAAAGASGIVDLIINTNNRTTSIDSTPVWAPVVVRSSYFKP